MVQSSTQLLCSEWSRSKDGSLESSKKAIPGVQVRGDGAGTGRGAVRWREMA